MNSIFGWLSGASTGVKRLRIEVGLIGCSPVKARMRSPAIVKSQIPTNRGSRLGDTVVGPQIDLLVFDAAPEPLNKHVVAPSALAIDAHMGNFGSSGFQVSEAWVNSGRCFEIQGLSPLHNRVRFRHQSKLTFGRRSGRLHHYPACGGRGLRKMRPF